MPRRFSSFDLRVSRLVWLAPLFCFLVSVFCAPPALAQAEEELRSRARLFPDAPVGITALKFHAAGNSRRYYLLAAHGTTVLVYDAAGKRLAQFPPPLPEGKRAPDTRTPPILQYGDDLDVACPPISGEPAAGGASPCFVYVADRAANAIKVFQAPQAPALPVPSVAEGSGAAGSTPVLVRTISVTGPTSVAVLAEGEVAVATMRAPRLVTVFDRNGKPAREFGEPAEIAESRELSRFLSVGRLASDAASHLYYSYSYLPEPTVKKYDRFGYATLEVVLTSLDFAPPSQAARRVIASADKPGARTADVRLVVSAIGVDPETQEIWIGIGGLIVHISAEGDRRGTYRLFTADGARIEPTAILVERDRLLVGSEALGVFEFPRPDKQRR